MSNRRLDGSWNSMKSLQRSNGVQSMRELLRRSSSSQKELINRLSGASSSDKSTSIPASGSAGNLAALNEEQKLVESIQRFSHHIPRCVLYFILQEFAKEREEQKQTKSHDDEALPAESTNDSAPPIDDESKNGEDGRLSDEDTQENKVTIQSQPTLKKSNLSNVSDDGNDNSVEANHHNGENGALSVKTSKAKPESVTANGEDSNEQEDENNFISGFLRGIGLMKKPGMMLTKKGQHRMVRRNTDIGGSNRHLGTRTDTPARSQSMSVYSQCDFDDIYAQAFLDEDSVNGTLSSDSQSMASSGASVNSSTEAALQRALILRGVIDGTNSLRNSAGSVASGTSRDLVRQLAVKEKPAVDVNLPEYSRHTTALLFVDISGFTKLSTLLDVETLSKTINSYFELIVSEITGCGGDILKFAGDALFAEWPVKEMSKKDSLPGKNDLSWLKTEANSIDESLLCAAICGASIVAKCSDFRVPMPKDSTESATLNVHCGLGAGEVVALLVGDNDSKKEFLLLGDPIDQVAAAEECASLGELAASPEAIALLSKTCKVGPSIVGSDSPAVIAFRSQCDFVPNEENRYDRSLLPIRTLPSHILDEHLASHCEHMDVKTLEELRKRISLYAHPVVRNEEIGSFRAFTNSNSDSHVGQLAMTASAKQSHFAAHRQSSSSSIFSLSSMSTAQTRERSNVRIESLKKRHQAEAELRSVFVIFIMPKMEAKVTGNKDADEALFLLLNKVMHVTTRELDRFKGHLRQFIVDDKGVVLIGTFGLRGSTFPNMSSKHALPATLAIHGALKNELGVDNQVGATVGKVYCGVVGGVSQHEFAVLGPSVNLAARLMASPKNPGMLVDDNVRMQTTNRFFFKLVSRVMAKGYATLVPIFEPIETKDSHVGKLYFVGRKKETYKFIRMASQIVWPEPGDRRGGGFKWSARKKLDVEDDELSTQKKKVNPPTKMMLVTSESGCGKSALLFNVTLRIQRLMGMNQKRSLVLRTASIERERLLLFSTFRRIFVSALSHLKDPPAETRLGTFSAQNSIAKRSNSTISSGGMNSMSQLKLSHGNLRISGASLRSGKFSTGASSTMLKNWSLNSMQSSSSSALSKSVSSMNTSSRGSLLALSRSKLISATSVRASNLNAQHQYSLMHRLRWICGKLGRSSDHATFVGRHLLKLDDESAGSDLISFSHEDILHFIVDAFLCCLDTDVTLITIDDVQWMDSFSWEILELVFQKGKNILVMCASRPVSTYPLGGTPAFWDALRNEHEKESRYAEIDLPNLELNDIRALTANIVGTEEDKIDKTLYLEVFTRSGGNPLFAREMLEEIKQLDMLDVNTSGLIIRRKAKGGEDLPFKIFEEHFLHKLDTLDPNVRTILQLCAVLGADFYLSDLSQIFHDSASTESKEEREGALNDAMDDAISERIITELSAKGTGDSEEDIEEEARGMRTSLHIDPGDRLFRFSNERWLKSVLSTMLDERIRDIHRRVAEVMEGCGLPDNERCSIEEHIKLFNHWKMSGKVHKAVSIALYVAMGFSGWDYLDQCLSLLHESLAMVVGKIGGDIEVGVNDEAIVSPLLSSANITDVQLLVRIRIEIGSRLLPRLDGRLAAGSFLRALAILQRVPERLDDFHDKSIIVDVATGISVLFADGVISDDDSITDLRLTEKLVAAARMDGDPCFICTALTYLSSIYAREGEFTKAIEVQKEAEEMYMEDDISGDLTFRFGIDRVALNASQMVQWLASLNEDDNAIESRIHFTVNNIIMHMDRSRVRNNFIILLPLLIVMKKRKAMVSRAKSILIEFVSSTLKLDENGFSPEVPLLKPLMDILTFEEKIAENSTSKSKLSSSNMQKIRNDERRLSKRWILEERYEIPNSLVRDGKALMAELCMFIACSARKWKSNNEKRKSLQFKGIAFAKDALELMKGNGLCAFHEAQLIEILRALSSGRFASSRLISLMRRSDGNFSDDSDVDDDFSGCGQSSTMSLSIRYAEWDESQNLLKTRNSNGIKSDRGARFASMIDGGQW